jgi:peroxiredoxin
LADYRDQEAAIAGAGAKLAAISVDSPEKSHAVRDELRLNFPIFCDTHRRVAREWGVYNAHEKGGIAKPAVFILNPGCVVRYASVDEVVSRVPASEIVHLLSAHDGVPAPQRRRLNPGPRTFFRAVRNSLHFGVRQPESESK